MKKILALILAIVISVSLCACSQDDVTKTDTNTDSIRADLIGTWERGPYSYSEYYTHWQDQDWYAKYECKDTIEFLKDGTGTHNVIADPQDSMGDYENDDYTLTWEIENNKVMIKFEYPGFEFEYSEENGETCLSKPFIYDKKNNTLSSTDGKIVFTKLY